MENNGEVIKKDEDLTPEERASKDTKKYLDVLETIKKVTGKTGMNPPSKMDGDSTAEIVAELFAEENEKLREKVKDGLKALLKQHLQLEADVKAKKSELEKLQLEKRKEFTKAAKQWLQQIDQNAINQEAYGAALETAFKKTQEKEDTNS